MCRGDESESGRVSHGIERRPGHDPGRTRLASDERRGGKRAKVAFWRVLCSATANSLIDDVTGVSLVPRPFTVGPYNPPPCPLLHLTPMTPSKKKFALIPVALSVATFLLLSHPVHAESTPFRGVPGSRQPLYERKGDTWTCLDGSKTIPYSAINDDYCDCADASDEPGTSACPNGRFWCANAGHIPAYIKSSRVNDGVCDSECCDGSDETSGLTACANTCREVGAKHRERQREVNRLLEDGARVKRELIKFGEEKKVEREAEKQKLETEIAALRVKVDELRAIRDQAESAQALAKVAADKKTKPATTCPPCPRCLRESAAGSTASDLKVAALRSHLAVVQGHLDTLLLILHDMKRDHNQNYHDLAVKSAISGYDELVEEWDKQKDDIKKDLDELDVPDDDDASVSYDEDFLDDDVAEEVAAEEVAAEDAAVEDEEVKRTSEGVYRLYDFPLSY
ncbi:glucosidase II beta subunit-like-domain-containing protein [Jimgerdemannia flammicorona]|uniref:Glucosidase II beta subunit-like-domain-containing protein n=1 Tax=Jimgerdemannia flammicorona TaxID=994334 RepID=A0A433CZ65_9FUNG|nr:glucosidase II beta subunit-like-domain-containing protein [Jimgerdemannia flammicorona]